jgi:hypothetical protein
MKISTTAWAIKLRGRSLYRDTYKMPFLYATRRQAIEEAEKIADRENRNPNNRSTKAEAIRVKVRIEEMA